jgi:hypothetical protein
VDKSLADTGAGQDKMFLWCLAKQPLPTNDLRHQRHMAMMTSASYVVRQSHGAMRFLNAQCLVVFGLLSTRR